MKYLITGISGVGKTTVGEILKKKGYRVIGIDEEHNLTKWFHKETGKKGEYTSGVSPEWLAQHEWLWDDKKMKELLDQQPNRPVFVYGLTSDIHKHVELFDKIFLLHVPASVLKKR